MTDKDHLLDFLMSRRSVRKYLHAEVPLSLIDRLIETASWAPSAHNAQPWRFVVLIRKEIKEKLAREMAQCFLSDLKKDGVSEEVALDQVKNSVNRFSLSPVLIVACIEMGRMDRYPDAARRQAEEVMATQSLAASIQTFLLSASAKGLGACWFCAPLFCPDVVREVIGIGAGTIPQALITLGYPDEDPPPPPRLRVDEIRTVI